MIYRVEANGWVESRVSSFIPPISPNTFRSFSIPVCNEMVELHNSVIPGPRTLKRRPQSLETALEPGPRKKWAGRCAKMAEGQREGADPWVGRANLRMTRRKKEGFQQWKQSVHQLKPHRTVKHCIKTMKTAEKSLLALNPVLCTAFEMPKPEAAMLQTVVEFDKSTYGLLRGYWLEEKWESQLW